MLLAWLIAACSRTPSPSQSIITMVENTQLPASTPLPPPDFSQFPRDARGCLLPNDSYQQFVNLKDGYCLLYPPIFQVGLDEATATVVFKGPAHTAGAESVQASMVIRTQVRDEKSLDQILQDALAAYTATNVLRTSVSVDGYPGEIIEGIYNPASTRLAAVLTPQDRYILALFPLSEEFPQILDEADLLWSTVLPTLHFFPPGSVLPQVTEAATEIVP
jgi:hypothetical protein